MSLANKAAPRALSVKIWTFARGASVAQRHYSLLLYVTHMKFGRSPRLRRPSWLRGSGSAPAGAFNKCILGAAPHVVDASMLSNVGGFGKVQARRPEGSTTGTLG